MAWLLTRVAVSRCLKSLKRFAAQIQITQQSADATKFARQAVDEGLDRIVVAGGDGTVHQVVQGLAPDFPAIELCVIPMGTGNDLARSLGLNLHDLGSAAEYAFHCQTAAVDVVQVEMDRSHYFINAASGGFGSSVTFEVTPDAKKTWGAFAYWFAALGKFSQLPEYRVSLSADNNDYEGKVVGVAVNKGRYVGGGFPIAPKAFLDDGQLSVTVVPCSTPLELMGAAVDMALGRPRNSQHVHTFRTTSLRLTSDPSMPFSLDGELEHNTTQSFQLLPKKLRLSYGPAAALKRLEREFPLSAPREGQLVSRYPPEACVDSIDELAAE